MSRYFTVFLWFIFHRPCYEILNLGLGEKLGQMWMINRLTMITWQTRIRRDGLQPPALPSHSFCIRTDWLWIFGCEQSGPWQHPVWTTSLLTEISSNISPTSALERGDIERRDVTSVNRKEAYDLQVKPPLLTRLCSTLALPELDTFVTICPWNQ